MKHTPTSAFAIPSRLAAKTDPGLIADDEQHFAAIEQSLVHQIAELSDRLDVARKMPVRAGQEALDRDQEVHRLTARLRMLRRFGLDLCLGRMVRTDDPEPIYIGRLGLTDEAGRRLLTDWRSPVAEPFFGATHANPMGLMSRRRYRWTRGRVSDYWDEVFTADELASNAALDDQSAFIASLAGSRSPRMRDVLGTIQADQDAIIRAGSRGALVVDGGPGTGKTVVALHRAAYLLYADPRIGHHRGEVLFVGPHEPYLAYVSDVLPSLGEEGVQTCTLLDLVPEGATAKPETDPTVARLKASVEMVQAIEPAVRFYEQPPTNEVLIETPWSDVWLSADDWAEAFDAPEPGMPHNEARDEVREALIDILMDKHGARVNANGVDARGGQGGHDEEVDGAEDDTEEGDIPADQLRRFLRRHGDLNAALDRAWPLLAANDVVGDLWSVPAYLRLCAPWLTGEQVHLLQRANPHAWTVSDLPLLDAARHRLGDPLAARRKQRREATIASQRANMADVIGDLIETDDSEMLVMSMLRGQDLRDALVDESAVAVDNLDPLAHTFAHVIVDEAQELTDAEWQMLALRCPSRSFTIVGDRAQARHGFTESWQERLTRVGFHEIAMASLSINYRTPQAVMAEAEPVIRAVLPDANIPISIRDTGLPVRRANVHDLQAILDQWAATHAEGVACVVGEAAFEGTTRILSLTPQLAKGLEFDLVVLVDPQSFGHGVEGAVDRYVAMTRATSELVILTS